MKRKQFAILCLAVIACLQCCVSSKDQLLSEQELPQQFFTIATDKDTILYTGKGAIIKIPKGSLEASGSKSVKLEVKEAYTISDIVLGGLLTKSGKNLLSSGGMIYINPVENNVKIIKPITVSIPTKYQQDSMQLYTGKRNAKGEMDWADAKPLGAQELPGPLARGEAIFMKYCHSCHNPVKEATGPTLAFLDKRRSKDWLYHYITCPPKMILNDPLARCIYEHYNRTAATSFPDLTEEDIDRIFDYVNYKAANIDPSTIPDFGKAFDSCVQYVRLKQQLAEKKDSLIIDNGPQTEMTAVDPISLAPEDGPGTKPANMVHAAANNAVYYKFDITVFGWYNVDVLFRDLPGFENSMLTVTATGEYKEDINIYLVIPSNKVFVPGGPMAEQTDKYAFFTNDGQTPLPQNARAYIIAMGDHNGEVWFGKTEFVTSRQQSLEIQLAAMSKEQMNNEIKKLDIMDLDIKAKDSKNASQIRVIEAKLSELEKLKPKGCDCKCLGVDDVDTVVVN